MKYCPHCNTQSHQRYFWWANQYGFKIRWFFKCGRWEDETYNYKHGFRAETVTGHQCETIQPPLPLLTDKLSQDDLPF